VRKGVGCIALAAVVAGLGLTSAAGASSSDRAITRVLPLAGASTSSTVSALPLGSVLIYSNLGAGNNYNSGIGWTVSESGSPPGFFRVATSFVPSSGAQVTQIDLALGHVSGTNNATIRLAQDNGAGLPGAILGTFSVFLQPTFGTCCTLTTVHTNLIPVGAGHKYWVIATAGPNGTNNTWDAWNFNTTGVTSTTASDGGSGFVVQVGDPSGAFDVIGCAKLCKVQ
jgi:hypothetical protein